MTSREKMEYDVVIVGAGPSGLSTAIKLKQLSKKNNKEISICIVEKGSEVGSHILSGAVVETKSLDELIPNWKDTDIPVKTQAKTDKFLYLTEHKSYTLPTPPQMKNHGNYIVSLGNLCNWLGNYAENLGIEIYPGFSASEILFSDNGHVEGIATNDMGRLKDGSEGPNLNKVLNLKLNKQFF
jgi:Dehydrogenases (flavoproteins)